MNFLTKLKVAHDFIFRRNSEYSLKNLGVNCFFNQPMYRIDNIKNQSIDISNMLGIKHIRALIHWGDDVQPHEKHSINFSFWDDIVKNTSKDINLLLVVTGAPKWLKDKKDSRERYIDFFMQIYERYSQYPNVIGFQICNEINTTMFDDNITYDFIDHPEYYVDMVKEIRYRLSTAKNALSEIPATVDKLLVSAATTSLMQNYPKTLNYNKELLKLGIEGVVDYYAIHLYGTSPWVFFAPGGVLDFINSIKLPIMVTEIGSIDAKVKQFKTFIPLIQKYLKSIHKIYWYQYDGSGSTTSYGMRTKGESSLYYTFDQIYYMLVVKHKQIKQVVALAAKLRKQ